MQQQQEEQERTTEGAEPESTAAAAAAAPVAVAPADLEAAGIAAAAAAALVPPEPEEEPTAEAAAGRHHGASPAAAAAAGTDAQPASSAAAGGGTGFKSPRLQQLLWLRYFFAARGIYLQRLGLSIKDSGPEEGMFLDGHPLLLPGRLGRPRSEVTRLITALQAAADRLAKKVKPHSGTATAKATAGAATAVAPDPAAEAATAAPAAGAAATPDAPAAAAATPALQPAASGAADGPHQQQEPQQQQPPATPATPAAPNPHLLSAATDIATAVEQCRRKLGLGPSPAAAAAAVTVAAAAGAPAIASTGSGSLGGSAVPETPAAAAAAAAAGGAAATGAAPASAAPPPPPAAAAAAAAAAVPPPPKAVPAAMAGLRGYLPAATAAFAAPAATAAAAAPAAPTAVVPRGGPAAALSFMLGPRGQLVLLPGGAVARPAAAAAPALKHGEIHSTVYAAAVLTGNEYSLEVQMSAYTLLQILVCNRWAELSADEHQKITQLAYQHMKDVGHLGQQAAWPLKSKAAMLLAAVARQQGPDAYTALLPQLISSAAEGPMQAEISCMVLQFVSEDLTQFEERGGEWKRNYLSALLASVEQVLPFIVRLLQESFQSGSSAAQQGSMEAARQHAAVVSAALGTLGGFVDWAPMGRLCGGSVVEACSFFLGVPDFRDAALAVVKQVVGRKSNKDSGEVDAYASTMAKVGDALTAAAAGLLAAPNAQEELGAEGGSEEYARRFCGVVAGFADAHWCQMSGVAQQHLLLRHMLEFTRHPHLPLATVTLSFWGSLVREAGAAPGPNKASPIQSPRGEGQAAAAGAAAVDKSQLIPPECCQLLVQGLVEQLVRLPVRYDDADVPLWADSAADYKDAVGQFRSQAKLVIRAAAKLAPSPVLNSVAAFLQAGLQTAANSNSAATAAAGSEAPRTPQQQHTLQRQLQQGHMALEADVILLESVLPSLCDAPVVSAAGLKEGLAALLQQLMAQRYREPLLVTLHARGLEAFSKLVPLVPELLVPLLVTSFECLAAVPLEQSGQLPPPAKVTQQWKEDAMARLAMAKVMLNVAKEAPSAFLPHLEALVGRIQQLWDAGQLREGEKVALHEGLMAAASGSDVQLQHQLLDWLLRPVHAKWSTQAWLGHLAGPAEFAAEYMQHEVQGAAVVVGSSPQRWSLHHELQLFERVLRRTPPPDKQAAAAAAAAAADPHQQQQQPQQQQHPFTPHLEWCLLPVAAITRCLHGMYTADIQARLSPIAAAFRMDPVERALRVGGEREVAKKSEEEAGTIAGLNVPALRYWLRSIREGCYMITSYAAQHVGSTLWSNARLASMLPQALASHLDVMEDWHLRILLRHGLTPLMVHCPVAARPAWLLPILSSMLPLMHGRLSSGWGQVAAAAAGAGSGQQHQQQQQQQLSDEVVGETLLREVTREYVGMLVEAVRRAGAALGLPGSSNSGGTASANGGTAAAAANSAAAMTAGAPAAAAAAAAAAGPAESVVETLWQYDGQAMQALMATAVAGMCWPDAPSAGKCTTICRCIAVLAESSHPELELLLLPDMLRSAMLSAVQVSSITIQPEVMHLLRQLLVTWLPRSEPIRQVMLALPHVTPQVLHSFQEQLLAQNSEKDQRSLIKQLLAEAGGEAARAVLSAISKVPVANVSEPKAKQQAQRSEADDVRWDWSEAGIAL
ncbi:armadillo-type protein [Scenedesmus sp. NREL 46B-D3]|nr:armadillo-type protein [Scenedesmus sp. NREL 46B-D3]